MENIFSTIFVISYRSSMEMICVCSYLRTEYAYIIHFACLMLLIILIVIVGIWFYFLSIFSTHFPFYLPAEQVHEMEFSLFSIFGSHLKIVGFAILTRSAYFHIPNSLPYSKRKLIDVRSGFIQFKFLHLSVSKQSDEFPFSQIEFEKWQNEEVKEVNTDGWTFTNPISEMKSKFNCFLAFTKFYFNKGFAEFRRFIH